LRADDADAHWTIFHDYLVSRFTSLQSWNMRAKLTVLCWINLAGELVFARPGSQCAWSLRYDQLSLYLGWSFDRCRGV
jgi:hypothetical protein